MVSRLTWNTLSRSLPPGKACRAAMRGMATPMSAAWTVCPIANSRRTSVDAMKPAGASWRDGRAGSVDCAES